MTNRVVDGGAKVVGENPSIQANPTTSSHLILEEMPLPQDMPTIVENEQEEVASEKALEQDESDNQIQKHPLVPYPRVHQGIQRDHPMDNILGSIRRGVTARSRLANFCEFYSFVSSLEPLKVKEALVSHPVLEGKPNANHVRARISNSRTQQLHNMDITTQYSNSIKKGNSSRLHHMSETST
jgi:hypothetical protein